MVSQRSNPKLPVGKASAQKMSLKAILSLVFGLLSIVLAFITGIVAILLGILALGDISNAAKNVKGKGLAITGIVMGALGVLWTIPLILIALLLPAVTQVRSAARHVSAQNNMRQAALALINYESTYGSFPPAESESHETLSWRVHILPLMGVEELALYEKFNLDEPWDSPTNKPLVDEIPLFLKDLEDEGVPTGYTRIVVPLTDTGRSDWMANQTIFVPGESPASFANIRDGASNTILLLKVDPVAAVPWTKPQADWKFDPDDPARDLMGDSRGLSVAMADGSVHTVSKDLMPKLLKAMFTRDASD